MFKSLFRLPAKLFKAIGLITPTRLARLWYYVRTRQTSIIVDRVLRLLSFNSSELPAPRLYAPPFFAGPVDFSPCESPLVSIVVPVYNHWATTRECLISIRDNTVGVPFEIIVADDCSQDDTRHLSSQAPGVVHVRSSHNTGFLLNCNNAARHARGKYLVLLNNDTHVQPGWLAPLVKLAEQNGRAGIVGSMLLYPDGRIQEAGGIIWQDGSGWNYGRFDSPQRAEYNYLKEVDYISGACILIRKSLWDQLGGFDPRFAPAYYEDTDLAFAVRRLGYQVLYQPLSRVVHLEGVSHGTDISSGVKAHQANNRQAFRAKWASILDKENGRDPRDLFLARDRSLSSKRLLYVDHYVPLRDQDAGSKSTFQYLSLMAEMGYKLTFLGDNFVAHQPYTGELQQMGIEVLYGVSYYRHWKRWLVAHGHEFDYVYLSRPAIARKYLPHIRRHSSAKVMYCGHDLHFLREERHYELTGKQQHLNAAHQWARLEENILRQADMNYFFSSFEVEEIQRRFPGVSARTIPLFLFDDVQMDQAISPDFADRNGLLFVGGFMHTPNVDGVRWFVEEVLPLVRKRLPDLVFSVVGSNPPREVSRLACDYIRIKGRVSDDELLQLYRQTRVVVAPLRFGAGVKGKIVEAMYHHVPTVMTSVGAEGIGSNNRLPLVADGATSFAQAVIQAYTNAQSWHEAQAASREIIRANFSRAAARSVLRQDLPL
jgi:O-antigen biosynthesis protein